MLIKIGKVKCFGRLIAKKWIIQVQLGIYSYAI